MRGYAHRLSDDKNEKAVIFNEFFTQKMNIHDLYVSGHWDGIIKSWVMLQVNVVNDKNKFAQDFKLLNNRIINPVQYTDFVGKITFYLTQYGKDSYIDAIAPIVISSGKITAYEGKTMQVYVKAMIGSQAPDLVLPDGKALKSQDLAQGGYEQTLLLFFDTGCGHCEEVIKQLQSQYADLQVKKIRIMTFAADADEAAYKKAIAAYAWTDNYCDFKSMAGLNFKNYAVPGTPTLFLLDKKGVIVKKSASLSELFETDTEFKKIANKF
jgi:thiol-disulfide isomerase/thioredoxin